MAKLQKTMSEVHKYSIFQILKIVSASILILFAVSCKTNVEHEHSFATQWTNDNSQHWHECECGEKSEIAAHEEDEGTVTTAETCTKKGVKTYKCKTCGYVMRTEEIPPLGFVKVTDTTVGSFYIAETELTYARWREVYDWATSDERGENKYVFQDLGREGSDGTDGAEPTENSNQPVTRVSWRDAIIWCNAASEMENLTPYYYVEGTTDFTDKTKVVRIAEDYNSYGTNTANTNTADAGEGTADKAVCNIESNGYRLPTEAEWEYAAKGGENFAYSGSDNIDEVAWYGENSENKTHDVGTKKPNKYGLKDMSGNVFEWCWDPSSSGSSNRVRRGGSWYNDADGCAVSPRNIYYPYGRSDILGFRVCRSSAN